MTLATRNYHLEREKDIASCKIKVIEAVRALSTRQTKQEVSVFLREIAAEILAEDNKDGGF